MPDDTWTYEELFEGVDPAPSFVGELERLGLLRVVARDAGGRALYGPEARDELDKVLSLVDLGYQPKDIAAIARKVGLPEPRPRRLFRKPPTYVRLDELARRSGIPAQRAEDWVRSGVLTADLVSDSGDRHFAPVTVDRARLLGDLVAMGTPDGEVDRWAALMSDFDTLRERDEDDDFPPEQREAARQRAIGEADALLPSLGQRLERLRTALRRWDKLTTGYQKRLARIRRATGDRRSGRRRRVRTRTRGRKGPGAEG